MSNAEMKKQSEDIEVYKISEDQKNAVDEARQQGSFTRWISNLLQ